MSSESPNEITIAFDIAGCVNYASWQNSVPLLRSLEVTNHASETLDDLRLICDSSPSFTRSKEWVISRLAPGESITIRDRDVQLDPTYLNGLDEAEKGLIKLRLVQGETLIAEATHEIRMLARDEWGGMNSMAELLAAFVMPNDPALAPILKLASNVLAKHGHSSALDGYQSRDPKRAYLLAASIWSAIGSKNLTYANPPRSFERVGQKTRRPSIVLSDRLATCLDSTLLFAAAIEAVGLNPIIVLTEGHCFAGVWLVEKTFSRLIETDASELRKAIAARELVVFETTLITHRPPARFNDAEKTATAATRESAESQYQATIDITRARMSQIRPLASHQARESTPDESEATGPLPLPAAPNFGSLPAEEVDAKPTTPEGRIERWQRKLLDLSLRNRLLNFKPTKQTVPLHCSEISQLEDRLASGKSLKIVSLPDQNTVADRDNELHRARTSEDLDDQFAIQALARGELAATVSDLDLTSRLTDLFRSVRNDLAEGGSNTLFLVVGFLKWKQKPEDSTSYRAPLLLLPVKLTRTSALSPFLLSQHEDEVRFNATLIQLLKKDFGRDLSQFETSLPGDDSGVDVALVLERVRAEIRDVPGFEVVDECALATFSFAKYLMWKDLVDRSAHLEKNRVVRHLIRDPDKPFESFSGGSIPHPREIDQKFEPKDIFHPLPADSSQLAAVMAASQGQDFVLIGPPGTGKSQTIANIICQCLATGKTVLFVAEKTAALDVVYRRLRERGLGDCCLELHSNKAERRKFLDQLDSSWKNNRRAQGNDWLTISERLKIRRDELNGYVAAIHQQNANGWSAYQAFGVCAKGGSAATPILEWADTIEHDVAAYSKLESVVGEIALTFGAIDAGATLPAIQATEWSATWEANLMTACGRVEAIGNTFRQTLSRFATSIGINGRSDLSLAEIDAMNRLAKAMIACQGENVRLIFNKQFDQFPAAVKDLRTAIAGYEQARQASSADYGQSLDSIPLDEIDLQWRKASTAFWPMSWLAKRKTTRFLQTYAASGEANPAVDVQAIRTIRDRLAAIEKNPLAGQTERWNHHQTDTDALEAFIGRANELRQSIIALGRMFGLPREISKALLPVISSTSTDQPVLTIAQAFLKDSQAFLQELKRFGQVAGALPVTQETSAVLTKSLETAAQIQQHRTQLQRWTSWRGVTKRAAVAGLTPFVRALESSEFHAEDLSDRFRLAYARWWLPKVIDHNPTLRTFQRFKHEDAIADFRQLDEQAREMASSRAKQAVAHNLPTAEGVPRQSELGMLRHQIGLTRPSRTIREMITSMPESFGKLAPCLLMSPLSIAQYLPTEQALFDVVIFDEASQITTWDAIGAIARGNQTIIVGDPKQLPPTNFFGRSEDDADSEELEDHEKDLESILDEASASGLPTLMLNWHYRSRHESLIAFSNYHYYGNRLVTFPAADLSVGGVKFQHLPQSQYDRGKSRTNRKEAEAILRDAVERMKQGLALPEKERMTFGVITFNVQQQSLIQDLFDQAQRNNPELDWYFSDDRIEPTVVKNLENVQGDERDVMFFSITFGPDAMGKVPLTFGALNRDGGERRLNVAVTRARQELVVYSSFRGDQLAIANTKSRGVKDLKHFLDYAEKGPIAIQSASDGSVGGFDSPFEEAVSDSLAAQGWQLVSQVGVSGFRVDLGVVHPDRPGAFLAGVECDGATYHRSAAARDRDKTRQAVLEGLGWNLVRIWSPDWWYDSRSASQRVHLELSELLEKDRKRRQEREQAERERRESEAAAREAAEIAQAADDNSEIDEANASSDKDISGYENAVDETGAAGEVAEQPLQYASRVAESITDDEFASEKPAKSRIYFCRVKLSDLSENQPLFFESSYDETLRSMAAQIISQEAPIRDDVVARQIARAHGFARTGANIRDRILSILRDFPATDESTGRFLWNESGPQEAIDFREAMSEEDKRAIDEISLSELRGLIRQNTDLLQQSDPAVAIARAIGFGRLSQQARERIAEAIEMERDLSV